MSFLNINKLKSAIVNLNGVLLGVRSEAYKQVGKRRTTKQDFKVLSITISRLQMGIFIRGQKYFCTFGKTTFSRDKQNARRQDHLPADI